MPRRLIADVGGTNARFALVDAGGTHAALPEATRYAVADFPGVEAAMASFLDAQGVDAATIRRRADAVAE